MFQTAPSYESLETGVYTKVKGTQNNTFLRPSGVIKVRTIGSKVIRCFKAKQIIDIGINIPMFVNPVIHSQVNIPEAFYVALARRK